MGREDRKDSLWAIIKILMFKVSLVPKSIQAPYSKFGGSAKDQHNTIMYISKHELSAVTKLKIDHQTAKFSSLSNLPAIQYIISKSHSINFLKKYFGPPLWCQLFKLMRANHHTWPSGSSGESKFLRNWRKTWSSVHSPLMYLGCCFALYTLQQYYHILLCSI